MLRLLSLALALCAVVPAEAGPVQQRRRECRVACVEAVRDCVLAGQKIRRCKRQTRRDCMNRGVVACGVQPSTTSTTSTTTTSLAGPSTTSTTVRPHQYGPLIGTWVFTYVIDEVPYNDTYRFTEVIYNASGLTAFLHGRDLTRAVPVVVGESTDGQHTFAMVEQVAAQCLGYLFNYDPFVPGGRVYGITYTLNVDCSVILDGPFAVEGRRTQ